MSRLILGQQNPTMCEQGLLLLIGFSSYTLWEMTEVQVKHIKGQKMHISACDSKHFTGDVQQFCMTRHWQNIFGKPPPQMKIPLWETCSTYWTGIKSIKYQGLCQSRYQTPVTLPYQNNNNNTIGFTGKACLKAVRWGMRQDLQPLLFALCLWARVGKTGLESA